MAGQEIRLANDWTCIRLMGLAFCFHDMNFFAMNVYYGVLISTLARSSLTTVKAPYLKSEVEEGLITWPVVSSLYLICFYLYYFTRGYDLHVMRGVILPNVPNASTFYPSDLFARYIIELKLKIVQFLIN